MRDCIAVTRGGWGEVWGFDSPAAARAHPLIQDSDVVVTGPEEVLACWNYLYIARVFSEVLGDREAYATHLEAIQSATSSEVRQSRAAVVSQELWRHLRTEARVPPEDPEVICAKVVEDRRMHDSWRDREQTRRSQLMTAQNAAQNTPAADAKPAAPKTIAGFAPTAKISFGADKDGKSYDTKENNPKRGKSAERFALYKAGQTVEQAVAAGVNPADLKWDTGKGFIKIA